MPEVPYLVYDVEPLFLGMAFTDTFFTRKVLRQVEHAVYVDEESFKDRFGRILHVSCLSTSSKILIAVEQCDDCIINCSEIGDNAISLLLELGEADRYIFFNTKHRRFQGSATGNYSVNGVVCHSAWEITETMGRLEV